MNRILMVSALAMSGCFANPNFACDRATGMDCDAGVGGGLAATGGGSVATGGGSAASGGGSAATGGGTTTGGGAAVADSGTPVIGSCPNIGLEGVRPLVPSCVTALPTTGYGGTIVAGTYRLTGIQLTPSYYQIDDAGTCQVGSPSSLQGAMRLRIAPTKNPNRYDFEAIRGYVLADGGTLVQPGSERGTAIVSPDGLSLSFAEVTCSDAGSAVLSDLPRLFRATETTLSTDCCRTSVADAGGAPDEPGTYLIEFTRE